MKMSSSVYEWWYYNATNLYQPYNLIEHFEIWLIGVGYKKPRSLLELKILPLIN